MQTSETSENELLIQKMEALGPLPDAKDEFPDELLEQMEDCLNALKAPLARDLSYRLVSLLPEEGCYGLEFKIVHLIEQSLDKGELGGCYTHIRSSYWKEWLGKRWHCP